VNPGQTTTVAGTGFPPGQPVLVQLFSDPVTLGTATADATGAFRLVVTVPSATTPGVHTLVATGPGGRPRAEAPLNVSAPTGLLGAVSQVFNLLSPALTPVQSTVTLARTGSESARATRLAGLLVALGVALVAAGWSAERATAFPARSRRRGSRRRRRRI
jgi:hypothetical protein